MPQELADNLDSENFGVAECRSGSAARPEAPDVLESVIYEAEDRCDEGAKIHKKTSFMPVGLDATERREVFCLAQVLKETCTRG